MTAGRLSRFARDTITEAISSAPNTTTALDYARQLITTTPEYHSTGIVRHLELERQPIETQTSESTVPYKAVVYVMLDGGMDSFNLLAPHTCSTRNSQGQTLREQYEGERTSIAMSESERTRIVSVQGQPCSEFAIHQNLPVVERMYNDGDLAFFANIGVLDEPVTKESFFRTTELFAHNIMQDALQRIDPWSVSAGTGILGRTSDRLANKGFSVQPITIEDASVATVGFPGQAIPPIVLSSQGLNRFNPGPAGEPFNVTQYVDALNGQTELHSTLFGETWSQLFQKASVDSNLLVTALENTVLTQTYSTESEYTSKMKAVSSIILTRDARASERDVIFVSLGGWDHHQGLKTNLATEFNLLNEGFEVFEAEMKAQGLWDQVSVVVASDFARTLTANSGEGSDHAWGGNTFIFGGDVKGMKERGTVFTSVPNHVITGSRVYGSYPDDITPNGSLNIGRGRLIPTSSWETMLNPVVSWLGLDTEDDLDYAMPNRIRAGARLYRADEIFESDSSGGGEGSNAGLLSAFLAVLAQILQLIVSIFS